MSKTIKQKDGGLLVPDVPIIPFTTGDEVGAEITSAMRVIVGAAVDVSYGGSHHIERKEVSASERASRVTGSWLLDRTMGVSKEYLIGIKGPLTTSVSGGIRSLDVTLRQTLDLYACLRLVHWFRGVVSPVKESEKVSMHIFREDIEDIYAGIEREVGTPEIRKFYKSLHDETGVSKVRFLETFSFGMKPVSREGTERLVRAACRYILQHRLSSVILMHKGDIVKFIERGFEKWGYELAERESSDATASGKLVIKDCTADVFLQNTLLVPEDYPVITALNLNGDCVSDQLAAMVGGIGIAPGANINYDSGHTILEAIHGTIPNTAGRGVANSCSLILSTVMILEYLGQQEPADLTVEAFEASFIEGKATNDLARFMRKGQLFSTSKFTEEIINRIKN